MTVRESAHSICEMEGIMPKGTSILRTLVPILFGIVFTVGSANAQGMGMGGQQQMQQQSMQHMQHNMQSMQDMMKQMQGMMNEMHSMMQGQQGMGEGHNTMMHGQQMMGSSHGMGNMVGTLNDIGKNMQQFMDQMNGVMSNKTLMDNPEFKRNMQQLQTHMGSMMDSMGGMVKNMEQMQNLQQEGLQK